MTLRPGEAGVSAGGFDRRRGRGFAARFLSALGMTGDGVGKGGPPCWSPTTRHEEPDPTICHSDRGEESGAGIAARASLSTRFVLVLGALAILAFWQPAGAQDGTGAADGLHHAGLVIRHGDGRITYAYVTFPEDRLSGIELLERSGVEQVTIPFGALGMGVCAIEGEGCPASECRRRVCQAFGADAPYWRYFGLDETGTWQPFALGASSAEVRDGAVHGWSWTGGEPGLPDVSLLDIARLSGAPAEGGIAGDGPTAFVRTISPAGVAPPAPEDDDPNPLTYGGAGAILVLIGGGALYALHRGRAGRRGRETEESAA